MLSRRTALAVLGGGTATVLLAACSSGSDGAAASSTAADVSSGEIPDETAGPYPADGSNGPDVLTRSGVVRSDIRSSIGSSDRIDGVQLTFTLDVTDLANGGTPFAGVAVYAWHCDAQGRYSMYSDGVTEETFLRGVQVADTNGSVTFTSILPGCYSGRWPHIHFEVYPDKASITDHSKTIATSQLALPQDACDVVYGRAEYTGSADNLKRVTLADDNVFGDTGGASQLATMGGNATSGYTARLAVPIDTRTAPTGGGMPLGGMPPGGPNGQRPSGPPRSAARR